MTGTEIVLVIVLAVRILASLLTMLTAVVLAWRNGQRLRSVSWSPIRGFTAEFDSTEFDSVRKPTT